MKHAIQSPAEYLVVLLQWPHSHWCMLLCVMRFPQFEYWCQILLPNIDAKYWCQILIPNSDTKYWWQIVISNCDAKYWCLLLCVMSCPQFAQTCWPPKPNRAALQILAEGCVGRCGHWCFWDVAKHIKEKAKRREAREANQGKWQVWRSRSRKWFCAESSESASPPSSEGSWVTLSQRLQTGR